MLKPRIPRRNSDWLSWISILSLEVTRYDGISTLHRGPLVAKEHGSGSPKLDFLAQQLHIELKITALIMKKLCTLQMLSCARYCIHIYDPGSRFATTPPPTWYGPKTCVLQHSPWKRCICSVFCMVGCWCGPQPCKFVGFLQPTFRKRVICNVSASTSWSSAAAPSSSSVSNYHIILNLLLRVFSLGTGLISVYILCLSNFLLECLVLSNWSNLKFT